MKVRAAALAIAIADVFRRMQARPRRIAGRELRRRGNDGYSWKQRWRRRACPNVTACGGGVVGTWTVASSCLKVSGDLNLSLAGAGCASAPVTGSLTVTGTLTANADGTYSDGTVTTGDEQFTLAPACLVISSTPVNCEGAANIIKTLGYASLTCTPAAGGGCTCAGTVHQTGGFGLVSVAPSTIGSHTTSGNLLTLSGDAGDAGYSYCVSTDKLTVTPQSTSPTMTGTIVLQKSGSSGSGGTTGGGGTTGAGGRGGSGGTTGAGGSAGTGGTAGAGGRGGSGGTAGAGGRGGGRHGGQPAVRGGSGGTAGAGGTAGGGGAGGSGGSGSVVGPCDIYKNGGNPCVAAHSTVRALFGAYSGKLYQVRNAANTTKDILDPDARRLRRRAFTGLVLCGHHLRHHRRLRPVRARQRPVVPGLERWSPARRRAAPRPRRPNR